MKKKIKINVDELLAIINSLKEYAEGMSEIADKMSKAVKKMAKEQSKKKDENYDKFFDRPKPRTSCVSSSI